MLFSCLCGPLEQVRRLITACVKSFKSKGSQKFQPVESFPRQSSTGIEEV